MDKVLFLDACIRSDSRTKRLAAKLLERIGGEISAIDLTEPGIVPLSRSELEKRESLIAKAEYSDPMFDYAKAFAGADVIVIAAPYWDLSFPSVLKVFIERISVRGITFTYTEDGVPVGLSRAKKLYYVTTMGAEGLPYDFGFGYVKAVASMYFGIRDAELITAEGLDLFGNDPERILSAAEKKI